MMQQLTRRMAYSVVVLALITISFLAGQTLNVTASHGASNENAPMVLAPEITAPFSCQIDQVTVFNTRFHIHCTTSTPDGVYYFTYSTEGSNAAVGNRMLMIANTVFALGGHIVVGYDTDAANNLPGCYNDCRNIVWVSARP